MEARENSSGDAPDQIPEAAKEQGDGGNGFFRLLADDVTRATDDLVAVDSPYHRRTVVRTIFVAIEGTMARVRRSLLVDAKAYENAYGLDVVALLRGETYAVDDRGRPRTRQLFMPLETSVRFIVHVLQRHPGIEEYSLDLQHPGWEALKHGLAVRHRLTHPKDNADLSVSREDVEFSLQGFVWFLALSLEALHLSGEAFKRDLANTQLLFTQAFRTEDDEAESS